MRHPLSALPLSTVLAFASAAPAWAQTETPDAPARRTTAGPSSADDGGAQPTDAAPARAGATDAGFDDATRAEAAAGEDSNGVEAAGVETNLQLRPGDALLAADSREVTPEMRAQVRKHFEGRIAQAGGLTADEAAKKAAAASTDAQAQQARVESADAQVSRVGYQYAPRLTLGASYTRLSPLNNPSLTGSSGGSLVATDAPPGPLPPNANLFGVDFTFPIILDNYALTAGLVVPISDYLFNLSSALTGAKTAKRAAQLNEMAARVNDSANARLMYYEWVRAKLRVSEAEQSIERASQQLESTRKKFAAGRAARADVLRNDAFLASAELNLQRARTQEAVAREQLNVLMGGGEHAQPDWEIGEDFVTAYDEAVVEKTIAELQQEAMENRLEVRALDNTAYSFRQKAKVERTMGYPRVEGFANAMYANPNPRIIPQQEEWEATWDVGVRLSWTINDLGTSTYDAKTSEADAREIEAQKRGVERALRTEVLSNYRALEEARLATSSAHRGLAAAESAYRDRVALYENGRATSLDLLESESALITARLDLVDAYIALKQARVRLDHAVGRDVASVVTPPARQDDPTPTEDAGKE